MKQIKAEDKTIWVIVHDSNEVVQPTVLQPGQLLSTAQPFLEYFYSEEEMAERLSDLTGNPLYWENYKSETFLPTEWEDESV